MPKDIEIILKEFIRHVSGLKTEDDPAGTGFHREFRMLREIQTQNKSEDKFPTEDGRKEENLKKNRYKDILPRDDKRVKLKEIPGEKGSDYINATYIEDVNKRNGYIAAQGPMPHTVNDFWRMLWEQKTEIVFMACRLQEDGKAKCEKYWAERGESGKFGDITVRTENEEEIQEHFMKRALVAEKDGKKQHLTHFHYTGWPDHNTPSSPDALRCMIEEVREGRKKLNVPMVVHCSAGCGRTGTICAIDYAWTLLDKGMIEEGFSMFEIIKSMREQRMSMVQTPDQYEYTHMVMKSLCNEWLVTFASRDYENVVIGPPHTQSDPPEEVYNNIEINGGKTDNKESDKAQVVFFKDGKKDTEKLQRNSKPEIGEKPAIKQEKPEIRQQKPEILRQKPQVKENAAKAVSPRPKSMQVEGRAVVVEEKGEYVQVKSSATVSPPPTLPLKKNPPPNTAPLNSTASKPQDAGDPHKTTITLGAGGAAPKITKTGSVGVSHNKPRAPKPPAVQAFAASHPMRTVSEQTMFAPRMANPVSRQASAPPAANYENYRPPGHTVTIVPDQSVAPYENSAPSLAKAPAGDEPALPERNYKPEEAHPYDNVIIQTSTQPAKVPPSSSSSNSPSSTLSRPQDPKKPSQPTLPYENMAVPATGPTVTMVSSNYGEVRAMGGIPAAAISKDRRGSQKSNASAGDVKSNTRGQQIIKQPAAPTDQVVGVKLGRTRHVFGPAHLTAAVQDTHKARKSNNPFKLGKGPNRVAGPRDPPANWSSSTTYL